MYTVFRFQREPTFTSNSPGNNRRAARKPGYRHVSGVTLGSGVSCPMVQYRTAVIEVAFVKQHVMDILGSALFQYWFILKNVKKIHYLL